MAFYKEVVSCGLVMMVCGCWLHAARRRLLGCKLFRKLATCGVATGQLAGRLKPQAALFFFFWLLLFFFLFKPLTGRIFYDLNSPCHRLTFATRPAFHVLSQLDHIRLWPSQARRAARMQQCRETLKTFVHVLKHQLAPANPPPTTTTTTKTHTCARTHFSTHCSLSKRALTMKKMEKSEKKKEKLWTLKTSPSLQRDKIRFISPAATLKTKVDYLV